MAVRAVDFTSPRFSLETLIREALTESDSADPHIIVREVLPFIPEDAVWDALENCLVDKIREQIRKQRSNVRRQPQPSIRWDQVRADHESGALAIMRVRVSVGQEWKFLADCTRGDVAQIVTDHKMQAEKNVKKAEKYQKLSELMAERAVQVVSELRPDDVLEILE